MERVTRFERATFCMAMRSIGFFKFVQVREIIEKINYFKYLGHFRFSLIFGEFWYFSIYNATCVHISGGFFH